MNLNELSLFARKEENLKLFSHQNFSHQRHRDSLRNFWRLISVISANIDIGE
jgi:hypothetical protein